MGPSAAVKQLNLSIVTHNPTDSGAFARQFLRESAFLRQAALSALLDEEARRPLIESLRALVLAAREVRLDAVAEDLRMVQTQLQGKRASGDQAEERRDDIEAAFERMAAMLELEADREPTPTSGPVRTVSFREPEAPATVNGTRVVMVSERALAEGLASEDWSAADGCALHVERLSDPLRARQAVRAGRVDVLVVDTRLDGARALLEEVLGDVQSTAVAVIALGAFKTSEDASELLVLGVTRVLALPHSPAELRQACLEVAPSDKRGVDPIGEMSMDGLGLRLAGELQRGLCDAVDDPNRRRTVDYGQGAEILTTLWEAVARIRELVTAQSAGAVRFAHDDSVIAALPRAHWLSRARPRSGSDRAGGHNEVRATQAGDLAGMSVLVAEDDPSTNWFLSGVLRDAGATVIEAMDGTQALLRAYAQAPDLVLTDVVMPETSGLRVCQAIKQDVVLHAAPVLLLSWKRDMLQRMRELDLGADGYLLKEASAAEVVQRAREVLRPGIAIAERLRAEGMVRGRMDALGAYGLLRLACRERPDSRLTLRDAHYLYAVEIRAGKPVSATMTDEQGATLRGVKVLWSMLGVRGGRFGVEVSSDGVQSELDGTVEQLLAQAIARARAAQRLLSGRALLAVRRVELDAKHVSARADATPEPARGVLRALAAGSSPRDLILAGSASASLVEAVLSDAARYGAVMQIFGDQGQDVFEQSVALQLDVLGGKKVRLDEPGVRQPAAVVSPALEVPDDVDDDPFDDAYDDDDGDRRSVDGTSASNALLEALIDRDSSPAAEPEADLEQLPPSGHTPVLATRVNAPTDRIVVSHHGSGRAALPSSPLSEAAPAPVVAPSAPPVLPRAEIASLPADVHSEPAAPRKPRELDMPRVALPSDYRTRYAAPEQPKGMARYTVPIMFALVGLSIAITARWWREQPVDPPPAANPPQLQEQQAPLAPAPASAEPGAESDAADDQPALGGAQNELPVELPLTPAEAKKLKSGEGMLEIVVGRSDKVHIDGQLVGSGPVVKKPLLARSKPYEIKVKMRGEERVRYVVVKPELRTRLRVAPPWAR